MLKKGQAHMMYASSQERTRTVFHVSLNFQSYHDLMLEKNQKGKQLQRQKNTKTDIYDMPFLLKSRFGEFLMSGFISNHVMTR